MGDRVYQYDFFLSYHWRDHDAVERLARALETRGLRVFLDRWYLTPGIPWSQALEQMLERCRAVAICVSTQGLGPQRGTRHPELLLGAGVPLRQASFLDC